MSDVFVNMNPSPQIYDYLHWTSKDFIHGEIAIEFLVATEAWILIGIACGKVTISQGDNYEAKLHLLLKLIVIWYVSITIYD